MLEPKILTADQVEPGLLEDFLRRIYHPLKSAFINEYGDWWHHSNKNRLTILVEDKIVGYCAVIPTQLIIAGDVHSALWKVDLIIDPEYRGQGLQKHFDRRVREMSNLLIGFPNLGLSSKVHRKLGWNVREDARILLLPLWPLQAKPVRGAQGWKGIAVRIGAAMMTPLAAIWRSRLATQPTQNVWKMENFDADLLSNVFMRTKSNEINTTWRDASYFEWRYGAAPKPEEYSYYLTGKPESPSHYLISRRLTQKDGLRYTRILDVFGNLEDITALRDLLIVAVQDAIVHKSGMVTLLTSNVKLMGVAQRMGFLISAPINFCWISESSEMMSALSGINYWTLADSDNDAPD